ncbi:MAG: protein kinase, partial [Planctomycetes bacterium]|nr:protein kinase [Planctomycetota bacterium]
MTSSGEEPLHELVDEYVERRRGGEALDPAEFAARAGSRAGELAELLQSVDMLERAGGPSTTRPGDRLGEFRIVRELGRGGMGIVFEAEHVALQRQVALKVLDATALGDPSRIERFHREARAAARLHHTNIVPVYGTGSHGGLHFYAMQLIDGCSLDRVLAVRRDGAPQLAAHGRRFRPADGAQLLATTPFRTAARLALQVASALDYAHRHGVLHRDVKPANVLLDRDGDAWIADFGLARLVGEVDLTRSGSFVGTLRYMAPEQLRGGGDRRADVFALGLLLHELLTLRPPYGDQASTELLPRIEAAAIEPPSTFDPTIPRDLETIVLHALARDPGHRYQTAGAMANDLAAFLEDRPVAARRATWIERAWRWGRRNRAIAALGLTAGFGLAAAAALGIKGSVDTARALALAEDNVALALSGFDDVFASLTGAATAPEAALDDRVLEISAKDAAALQQLATFYDEFARRNETDARLRDRTVRAHERVGVIQLHLGEHAAAEVALRRALELAATPGNAVVAGLHVLIGRCRMGVRDYAGARAEFEAALAIDAADRSEVLYEQARAHDLLALAAGGRGWYESPVAAERPRELEDGWSERARSHHHAAEQILSELLARAPDDVRLLRARAGSLRFLAMLERDPATARARRAEARDSLERLVARFPSAPMLRAELAAVLSDAPGGPPAGDSAATADTDALARAEVLALDLAREFPSSAGVRELAIEVLTKAASRLGRRDPTASLLAWQQVVALVGRRPDATGDYLAVMARMQIAELADELGRNDDTGAALAALADWVDALDPAAIARLRERGAEAPARGSGPPRRGERGPPPPRTPR